MSDDLVKRLRRLYVEQGTNYVREAADEIERLRRDTLNRTESLKWWQEKHKELLAAYCQDRTARHAMSDTIAVCLIEVPEGEQLANDYPGYQYRQNLQMPPGSHPVYTADALRAKDAEIERLTAERDALKRVPLTEHQVINLLWEAEWPRQLLSDFVMEKLAFLIRKTERAHGIGGEQR